MSLVATGLARAELNCTALTCADLQRRLHSAEQALAQAHSAREVAMRGKADFIASISHELRTPLQTIIGFSELGASMAHAEHATYADMFSDICAGGQRMLSLVNALLDVSALSSSAGSLSLQRIDLTELIDCVVSAARSQASCSTLASSSKASALEISVECQSRPLWAQAHAGRMQQVLSNVISNARKFGATAGVARIEIKCWPDADGAIAISVRDHGPGIPADELEAVFEPFVQSSRTRDGAGGVGLGLTVCRKIMNAHGGSIHASLAPGGGTLIHLHLPSGSAPADAGVSL